MNTNPFDRVNLGYDGLFGPRTMFQHLQPSSQGKPLIEELEAPVMGQLWVRHIEAGTMTTVSLGFIWVFWKLLWVVTRDLGCSRRTADQHKKRD